MDLATRKLDLIARLALVEDEGVLQSVARALTPAESENGQVDPDEVLGTRPGGSPVTVRNSVADWVQGVTEVLAGGGYSVEEVIERLRADHGRDGRL